MFYGIFGMDSSVARIYKQFDKLQLATTEEQKQEIKQKIYKLIKYYSSSLDTDFVNYIKGFMVHKDANYNNLLSADMSKKISSACESLMAEYEKKVASGEKLDEQGLRKFVMSHLEGNLSEEEFIVFRQLNKDYDALRNISQIRKIAKRMENFDINSEEDIAKIAKIYHKSYKEFERYEACTIEWDLSFEHCHRDNDIASMREAKISYDYLKKQRKTIRALSCVYPTSSPEFTPPITTKEELLRAFDDYLDRLSATCPDVDYIDFFNELAYDKGMHYGKGEKVLREQNADGIILEQDQYSQMSIFERLLGDKYYIPLLERARDKFPNTKLYYNDYGHESQDKCENILRILDQIKKHEEKTGRKLLDGVGVQCRLRSENQDLSSIEDFIVKASEMNLEVQITECDVVKVTKDAEGKPIKDADEKQQAVYQEVFDIATRQHDKLTGFTLGDFNDETSFSAQLGWAKASSDDPSPTLYGKDGKIKPWGDAMYTSFQREVSYRQEQQQSAQSTLSVAPSTPPNN